MLGCPNHDDQSSCPKMLCALHPSALVGKLRLVTKPQGGAGQGGARREPLELLVLCSFCSLPSPPLQSHPSAGT